MTKILLLLPGLLGGLLWGMALGQTENESVAPCPEPASRPVLAASEIYRDTPFKSGENAIYEIRYAGLWIAQAQMKVNPPIEHNGRWHRQFHLGVQTLEDQGTLFRVDDVMEAISDPQDFRIAKFYLKQDEKTLFSDRFRQEKFLEFEHGRCKVRETIQQPNQAKEVEEFDLVSGAKDSLGVLYYLRTVYDPEKTVRTLVYSSEKNWWLQAIPVVEETVGVPAGEFRTTKFQLITYLGKELQQKGDVFIWIAQTPQRPIVMIQAEVAVGSLWLELARYEAGDS